MVSALTMLLVKAVWAQATVEATPAIKDPTQMTGSFSQALSRITVKPGQGGALQTLPNIQLVARAIKHGESKAVLLKVDKQNYLVKQGGKQTVVSNNNTFEIQVEQIENDFVRITLLPLGKVLFLH